MQIDKDGQWYTRVDWDRHVYIRIDKDRQRKGKKRDKEQYTKIYKDRQAQSRILKDRNDKQGWPRLPFLLFYTEVYLLIQCQYFGYLDHSLPQSTKNEKRYFSWN